MTRPTLVLFIHVILAVVLSREEMVRAGIFVYGATQLLDTTIDCEEVTAGQPVTANE